MPVVDGSIGGVMCTGPFGWSRRRKALLKKFAERSETVSDCLKVTLSFWKGSLVISLFRRKSIRSPNFYTLARELIKREWFVFSLRCCNIGKFGTNLLQEADLQLFAFFWNRSGGQVRCKCQATNASEALGL